MPVTQPPNHHLTQATLTFAPHQIGVAQKLRANGQTQITRQTFNHQAQWQQSWGLGEEGWETAVNQFPFLPNNFHPLTPGDKPHFHPAGWLIQQPQQLTFLPHS
ncbi:MAG: hypothetical protein R3D55_25605 [Chloroflexota bacterium]